MLKNPLRDIQDDPPALNCPACDGEVWPGQDTYSLYGRMVCVECFREEISYQLENDPRGLALELGIDVERVS